MLIPAMLALSLQIPAGQSPEFDIAGAYIGLTYAALRERFPQMACEVSCLDQTSKLHGFPGNLWVGVGDSAVNQVAFRFKPTLTDGQAGEIRVKYGELYGKPSRLNAIDDCEEWDRASGAIVLCVRNGLSITYWKDDNWGVTKSVIPHGT